MSTKFENLSAEDRSERLLGYAKGLLPIEQSAEVEAAAAQSPEILEELEYYKGLARAAQLERDSTFSPGEMGWARLSRELDHLELTNTPPIAANDNGGFWRYATLALGLVILGQWAFQSTRPSVANDPRYIPVTEAMQEACAQITFAESATEGQIRALLVSQKASIISGPSSLGVYRLSFASPQACHQGVSSLTVATDVVESAAVTK